MEFICNPLIGGSLFVNRCTSKISQLTMLLVLVFLSVRECVCMRVCVCILGFNSTARHVFNLLI